MPELERVAHIVREAGELVMDVYRAGFEVRRKGDASPVTEADERAEALIVPALRALAPGIPVVAVANSLPADRLRAAGAAAVVGTLEGLSPAALAGLAAANR